MENGYAFASLAGLEQIARRLATLSASERQELKGALRIGVQWDAEVTLQDAGHLVSQAYCSALPVSYSGQPSSAWEPFARFVLEAAYEATLHAGILNKVRTGSSDVFLTMLGGGAFGNHAAWIVDSIEHALGSAPDAGLSIKMVSYGSTNPDIAPLLPQ